MRPPSPSYPQSNVAAARTPPAAIGYLAVGLAVGIAATVLVFFALGGHFGGTVTPPGSPPPPTPVGCPTSTEGSIGSTSDSGPAVASDSVSVHSDAWAAGATDSVVTHSISVTPGSTLLVFVGWVGESIGGPSQSAVCDSSGDTFLLQTSTSVFASNHSQAMFVAFDVAGGTAVSFAGSLTDSDASAGGVLSVVDLTSSAELSLDSLLIGHNEGYSDAATVNLTAATPSFLVVSVTGQGDGGPYTAFASETLVATNGYYDTGPWGDGEAFGTMVGVASSGPVASGAYVTAGPYVWNAIALVVD